MIATTRSRHAPPGRLLALLLWLSVSAAHADFVVREAQPQIIDRSLLLNTSLDLALGAKPEEALSKGIPLDLLFDVSLVKRRRWVWDKVIADWTFPRRIQFHALSGQYLVSEPYRADEMDSFTSLHDALGHLGTLSALALPLTPKKDISAGAEYYVRLRVYLDIESLPSPLRPVAYTTPSWRLNSGWTEWPVQH